MPHVIIKMYPGRSEDKKRQLCERIVQDVMEIAGCQEKDVSVSIMEIARENWMDLVYKPDILDKPETLYKSPGTTPAETEKRGKL